MKKLILISGLVIFALLQQSAKAQSATTPDSADSLQISLSMSNADELFLFKNNAEFISTGNCAKRCPDSNPDKADRCPFLSTPESCSVALAFRRIENSHMLAQIK